MDEAGFLYCRIAFPFFNGDFLDEKTAVYCHHNALHIVFGDHRHADGRALVGSLDHKRQTDFVDEFVDNVALVFGGEPLGARNNGGFGRGKPRSAHQVFLRGFAHANRRRQNARTAVRYAVPFQKSLDGSVFALRAVQGEKRKVEKPGKILGFNAFPDFRNNAIQFTAGQFAQRFNVHLEAVGRRRQCRNGRIKIADGAFVNVFPIEQNEVAEAVHKNRHGLKQGFIEVVVHGAATGKRDFAFARGAAKNDSYFEHGRVKYWFGIGKCGFQGAPASLHLVEILVPTFAAGLFAKLV